MSGDLPRQKKKLLTLATHQDSSCGCRPYFDPTRAERNFGRLAGSRLKELLSVMWSNTPNSESLGGLHTGK